MKRCTTIYIWHHWHQTYQGMSDESVYEQDNYNYKQLKHSAKLLILSFNGIHEFDSLSYLY